MVMLKQHHPAGSHHTNPDLEKTLLQLMRHIDGKGFTKASLDYGWYEASWFRDSSMMILALCDAHEFLEPKGGHLNKEAELAAGRSLGFLWSTIGKFGDNVKRALSIDQSSDRFALLENHIPARVGENGYYFTCENDGVQYSDMQSDNKYIKLRQYDSIPLTLIATERFLHASGQGALDERTKETIRSSLKDLTAYMIKVYRTTSANAWELDEGEVHSYTVASISRGLRSAMMISERLGVDLSELGSISERIKEVDRFLEDSFVRDGILYKSVNGKGGTLVASNPNPYVDSSEIFIFTLFKPKLSEHIEKNTIDKIRRDLFNGNVLPIRYLGDTYFSGGRWLLLGLEFARYYAEHGMGDSARSIIEYVTKKYLSASAGGALPEQELVNPACPNADMDNWFKKNGNKVIEELGWAEAEYLIAAIAYARSIQPASGGPDAK